METDDEGETMLDSTTGSLVRVETRSGLKGAVGKGPGDGCASEIGQVWNGIRGRGLNGDSPGWCGIDGGAICTRDTCMP